VSPREMRVKKRIRQQLDLAINIANQDKRRFRKRGAACTDAHASYNMLIFTFPRVSGSNYSARSSPRQDIELISRGIPLVATSRMCIIDASARSRSNALADKVRANGALTEAARARVCVCILCMYIYIYNERRICFATLGRTINRCVFEEA